MLAWFPRDLDQYCLVKNPNFLRFFRGEVTDPLPPSGFAHEANIENPDKTAQDESTHLDLYGL